MQQSNRLQKLLEIEQLQQEQAGALMQQCRQEYEAAHAMHGQLKVHKQHYLEKLAIARSGQSTPEMLNNLLSFLSSIEEALQRQQQQIENAANNLSKSRDLWQRKHQRCDSLHKLINRHRRNEVKQEQKNAEKKLDDVFASRADLSQVY